MKVTAKEAIDYSSISNIMINIDWYCLISILIDYRFHRLSTPGIYLMAFFKKPLNKYPAYLIDEIYLQPLYFSTFELNIKYSFTSFTYLEVGL